MEQKMVGSSNIQALLESGSAMELPVGWHDAAREPIASPAALVGDLNVFQLSAFLHGSVAQPRAVAVNLLERFGSLSAMFVAGAGPLAMVEGVSGAAVQLIMATHELMATALREECFGHEPIQSPGALRAYLGLQLHWAPGEVIRGLFLDRAGGLITDLLLTPERPAARLPSVRIVAHHAVSFGAAAVILARNDCDAEPTAGPREVKSLKRIIGALGRLGISFHDYVIVGRVTTLSFRDNALF